MRYRYDNSSDNIANPNNPPQRVTAGNRAVDEMAHLWLQVLPESKSAGERDPRMVSAGIARPPPHRKTIPPILRPITILPPCFWRAAPPKNPCGSNQTALDLRPGDATVENAPRRGAVVVR
jgi:hypothetical protein